MQEADTIMTTPRRRALLGGIGAALAIGAGPVIAAPVEAEERLATVEELAALTFSAEGNAVEKCLGSRPEWIAQMANDYAVLRIAARAL